MEEDLLERFLESLRLKGRSGKTVDIYRTGLRDFRIHLERNSIGSLFSATYEVIAAYFHRLRNESGLSRSSQSHKAQAVCGLYAWLKREGYALSDPSPPPLSRGPYGLPRAIPTQDTLRRIYRTLAGSGRITGQRDYVIIDLAYGCGLRRDEIVRIDVGDICAEERTLRVTGKGGHERMVPVGKKTQDDLLHYLYRIRPRFLKGSTAKALFLTRHGGGRRIDRTVVNRVFWNLRKHCGLPESYTPHSLRHAFATDLLRNGAPLQDVSKMLGHTLLDTTRIYTRVLASDVKREHRKYHPRG
jgi:integrase/recombinase XerD